MVIKFSISVGLHDLYPAIVVNFAFRRKVITRTSACNFVSLGEKTLNCKVKKRRKERKRRRKKRKVEIIDHMIRQKKGVVSQCFLSKLNESWFNHKVQTA